MMEPAEQVEHRARTGALAVVVVGGLLVACLPTPSSGTRIVAPSWDVPGVTPVALPSPRLTGSLSLEEVLAARRSIRDFARGDLSPAEIGQLLWAAQGVTGAGGGRTAPSAGALYPLELFVTGASGTFRYRPDDHALEPVSGDDLRPELATAAGQTAAGAGAISVIVVGVPARTAAKYGSRADRYVWLEAGHATQNLLLEAVALNLGAVPIGAFDDEAVRQAIGLPAGWEPLYIVPVGRRG
jgi:SagB-type dehydrogenase family enzyme